MSTYDENSHLNNNLYFKSLDENFYSAIKLFEKNLTHEELIHYLINGNIPERQIAALKLDRVNDAEEALILCRNLVGFDGKIREAVALKVDELTHSQEFLSFFFQKNIYDIFLDAITDINSNVCRHVISALSKIKIHVEFSEYFSSELFKKTYELSKIVSTFDFTEGKYKVNKEIFKLYWYLETIFVFTDYISVSDIKSLVRITSSIGDYTIREKTAKILSAFQDIEFESIKNKLKHDKNYYVRRF